MKPLDLERFEGATAGPWVCDDRSGCVAVYPESRVGDGPGLSRHNDRNIHYSDKGAFYNGNHWEMDETAVIDARLIAAAPQLLAELKALRAWRERVLFARGDFCIDDQVEDAIVQAETELNNATT